MDVGRQEKPQPRDEICPQCKETIIWSRCSWCDATGKHEMGTMLTSCTWCQGRGWVKAMHICIPKMSEPDWSGMPRWNQPIGRTRFGKDPVGSEDVNRHTTPTSSGSGTRGYSSGSSWIIPVLILLVVGVVFVPELRELMRVILVALWALLLDLFAWLAAAIRSLTG